MKFTIITPSLNQLGFLKRCVASVRDQVSDEALKRPSGLVKNVKTLNRKPTSTCHDPSGGGVNLNAFDEHETLRVHHHIQDACSTDGTPEWLAEYKARMSFTENYQLSFSSEADKSMYDGLNKGFECTSGDLCAWLNCDEQYLPGSLGKVAAYFDRHPSVEIGFGGTILVNESGRLLGLRKAMPMRRLFLESSYLYNFSCAAFFRRSFWNAHGGFDLAYKNAGDEELFRRALAAKVDTGTIDDFLSAFTFYSENLSSNAGALEEHQRLKQTGIAASRLVRVPVNLLRLAEKLLRGGYAYRRHMQYALYFDGDYKRTLFNASRPTSLWPDKKTPYLISHRLK